MTAPTVFPPRFPRRLIFPTKGKPGAPRTYPPGPWRPRNGRRSFRTSSPATRLKRGRHASRV